MTFLFGITVFLSWQIADGMTETRSLEKECGFFNENARKKKEGKVSLTFGASIIADKLLSRGDGKKQRKKVLFDLFYAFAHHPPPNITQNKEFFFDC